ncbi:MAG: plastocyanin/azurin family copper-binding protein [Thermoanaerobaculia bacterium]
MKKFILPRMSRAFSAIALIALTACPYGGPHGDQSQNAPAKTSTTTSNPRAGEDRSATANPVLPPQSAPAAPPEPTRVELTEYSILIPPTLTPGHQRFTIVNSGTQSHNFVVEGNGASAKLPENLPRGDTTQMELDLKPGTYTVWCPVDGHRGKGMQTTVTVK